MRYYIYNVMGQLRSETLASPYDRDQVSDLITWDYYGLREVSKEEYLDEVEYNSSR